MFSTEKDLRKAVPKKPVATRPLKNHATKAERTLLSITEPSSSSLSSIVEISTKERERRLMQRELLVKLLKIQTWWRTRIQIIRLCSKLRSELINNISDIGKICSILMEKGHSGFVPPPETCSQLLSNTSYLLRYSKLDMHQILSSMCKFVLQPSLLELDATKNLMYYEFNKDPKMETISAFACNILDFVSSKFSRDEQCVLQILPLFVGASVPYKMAFSAPLQESFNAFRRILLTKKKFLFTARKYLTIKASQLASKLTAMVSKDEESFQHTALRSCNLHQAHARKDCEAIFETCLYLIETEDHFVESSSGNLQQFIYYILSTPLLTLLLSEETLQKFCYKKKSTIFMSILLCIDDVPQVQLMNNNNTPFSVIHSGQWLLGNLISLLPFVSITITSHNKNSTTSNRLKDNTSECDSSVASTMLDGNILTIYLNICTSWLSVYTVPGVLQGRHGIIWQKQGASLTAVAVPVGLEAQMLTMYRADVIEALINRIIAPISYTTTITGRGTTEQNRKKTSYNDEDNSSSLSSASSSVVTSSAAKTAMEREEELWLQGCALDKDMFDIKTALSSSSYTVTHGALLDHQEASTWFTSKWAQKIIASSTTSITSAFSSFNPLSSLFTSSTTTTSLQDSKIAKSTKSVIECNKFLDNIDTAIVTATAAEDSRLIFALCGLWEILLPAAATAVASGNTSIAESAPWKALSQISFATGATAIVSKLWCFLTKQQQQQPQRLDLFDVIAKQWNTLYAISTSCNRNSNTQEMQQQCNVLVVIVTVLRMKLMTLSDSELYESAKPLPLHQIVRIVRCLKVALYRCLQSDPMILTADVNSSNITTSSENIQGMLPQDHHASTPAPAVMVQRNSNALRAIVNVLSDLHARWARRPFSSPALWEIKATEESVCMKTVVTEMQQRTVFGTSLMRYMPWSVDFHERMKLFRTVIEAERLSIQGSNDIMSAQQRSRGITVQVHRDRILEDGMAAWNKVGANIKDRVVVRYVNAFGEEEAGIDAGGLFKDFVTDLSSKIFDPSYGLFCITTGSNSTTDNASSSSSSSYLLYPNPAASLLFSSEKDMEDTFVFLGKVLGKSMFENITLQPQFAHFFLAFMHGKYNYMNLVNDLYTLDPELYKNLMFLKTYEGNVEDLSITFSITDNFMSIQKEIELIPGGSNMIVTSQNRHRYINLAAKYYLHDRLKKQSNAFFRGLHQVIAPEWLGLFCAPELQILISGSQSGLDVDDMKRHTHYAGGYLSMGDRQITRFWTIFEEFSAADKALLLKFVTSCERPPSLGFVALQPPFTIQRVDCSDDQRLPTASTCFNILKLPTYSSSKIMKEKLLHSIRARAGFDLS